MSVDPGSVNYWQISVTRPSTDMLTTELTVPSSATGSVGLLGNYDGNSADDLTKPDGTYIASNSTDENIFNFGELCK